MYSIVGRITKGSKTVGFNVRTSNNSLLTLSTSDVIELAKSRKLDNATFNKSKNRLCGLYGVDLRKLPRISVESRDKLNKSKVGHRDSKNTTLIKKLASNINDHRLKEYCMKTNESQAAYLAQFWDRIYMIVYPERYAERLIVDVDYSTKRQMLSKIDYIFGDKLGVSLSNELNKLGVYAENTVMIRDGSFVNSRIYLTGNSDEAQSVRERVGSISKKNRIFFEIDRKTVSIGEYLEALKSGRISIVCLQI